MHGKDFCIVCLEIVMYLSKKNGVLKQRNDKMRAIIPVAGVGSRLRPHTYTIPKVLLNVAGKPIISHILDTIIDAGFDEATIIIGYLGEMIKEYVLDTYKIKIDFVEQEEHQENLDKIPNKHRKMKIKRF